MCSAAVGRRAMLSSSFRPTQKHEARRHRAPRRRTGVVNASPAVSLRRHRIVFRTVLATKNEHAVLHSSHGK